MKAILCILTLLAVAGSLAIAYPSEPLRTETDRFEWRRTKNGWEPSAGWFRPAPISAPAPHPAIVAGFELLVALTAAQAGGWRREAGGRANFAFGRKFSL